MTGPDAVVLLLLGALLLFFVGSIVSAILLRASVAFLNRGAGRGHHRAPGISTMPGIPQQQVVADPPSNPADSRSAPASEAANPYRAPASNFQLNMPGRPGGGATGELTFGRAWGIMFVAAIFIFALTVPLQFMLAGNREPSIALIGAVARLLINFVVTAAVIKSMLPTNFARACLISLIMSLIMLAIIMAVAAVLFFIGFLG